jgi:RNA polymerase sigma factor (sigma-70 family)
MPKTETTPERSIRRHARLSDPELIAACLDGDASAWDALLQRYEGLIYSVLVRAGLSGADADDLFQDVCLILYNHLDDLRDSSRLAGWLVMTARREVWRLGRRRGAALASELPEFVWENEARPVGQDPAAAPDAAALAAVEQHLVRQAMVKLQDRCRNLLTLLYLLDPPKSYQEVSSELGVPMGSIGPTRARCLQQLQKLLVESGF